MLKNIEEQHQIKNQDLKADNRYLKINQKENQLSHIEFMNALDFDNIKEQTVIRQGKSYKTKYLYLRI